MQAVGLAKPAPGKPVLEHGSHTVMHLQVAMQPQCGHCCTDPAAAACWQGLNVLVTV